MDKNNLVKVAMLVVCVINVAIIAVAATMSAQKWLTWRKYRQEGLDGGCCLREAIGDSALALLAVGAMFCNVMSTTTLF